MKRSGMLVEKIEKETNLGVAQGFFDHYRIPHKREYIRLPAAIQQLFRT